MKRRDSILTAALSALALLTGLVTPLDALAQTKLRVFSGGANQRPDLIRKLFDEYQKANSGVTIDIETGGAPASCSASTSLAKHGVAVPKNWDELSAAAKKIQAAGSQSGNPNLQGLSIQGAPIEGAVSIFLLPY